MNKYTKLGVIAIVLVCILWIHPTFAADTGVTATTSTTGWITQLFNALLKFLSRGWMLLAFLAGKLMSNDFIYGTFIHLDSALFKLWNYMKNIANFVLGFLFLFSILKSFFTKDTYDLKKMLPRFLVSGILIQMSRFMMGAFIDLANIATAAVGSFPTQFIQGSTDDLSKSKMTQMAVTVPDRIDISFKDNEPLFKTHTGTQTIESMFGKFNDMSGPLLFIGASIFRFQDYDIMNTDITNWKNFSIGLFIKLFLLLAFTVPMFILVVVNLMRIFKLRMRIAFAPLAAIAWSFDITGDGKETPGFIQETGKKLGFGKLGDVIQLIFLPVVMIGSLSLVMIISIGMYYVMGGDPGDMKGGNTFSKFIEQLEITSTDKTSTLKDHTSGTEISVDGDLFKGIGNFVGGMIGYLIITGFTAVLLWSLVKVSFSFSDFAKKIADPIFNFAENAVKTASIVPLPGGGMGTLGGIGKTPGLLMNQLSSQMSKNQGAATQQLTDKFYKTEFGKGVQNLSGYDHEKGKMKDISSSEANALQSKLTTAATANNIKGVAAKLQEFAKARLNEGKGVSLESPNFINALNTLLKNDTNFRKQMIDMVKITPAPKDTDLLEFNTKTSTNKKLLTGLMYIMNNPYNTSADRTSIENTIKTQMNGQEIKPNTSLIIGAEGNNTQ